MASTAPGFDFSAIVTAAREWINECLIYDGSLFTKELVWTYENFEQLDRYFVQQPNNGDGTFLEKLVGQLSQATASAKMLMAEIYWALQLFPSNSSYKTKSKQFAQIAELSGLDILSSDRWLQPEVLRGVGSGGPAYGAHFWREVAYGIHIFRVLKSLPKADRSALLGDHARLATWLESEMKLHGDRQFRHMLRYFAFPERVERMSSNRNRRDVLLSFNGTSTDDSGKWTDLELDNALLELRTRLAEELGTEVLDFYESPLKEQWQSPDTPEDKNGGVAEDGNEETVEQSVAFALPTTATNIIFYGPPGTGKTRKIEHLRTLYSDTLSTVNRDAWLADLVDGKGWMPVFVASMAAAGRPLRAVDIASSELAMAKGNPSARRSRRVTPPIGPYLYEHSVDSIQIPPSITRRNPLVFDRDVRGDWILIDDWEDVIPEAGALLSAWRAGPVAGTSDVQRYKMVTFHPSYGYEDFIQGIRPVEDEQGQVGFRTVDGTFKKLCDMASRNPSKRYAIFIDEINRANVSKVFGELITLIEPDKRISSGEAGSALGTRVQLPGTDEPFGVPSNVDIYGTMNTSDRSIALMDVALRRRFRFQEIGPDYAVLGENVGGVDLARLLRRINDRLEYLLDSEHRIGHGYLTAVRNIDQLRSTFSGQIIPLLEEYFFDRKERIASVLSDATGRCRFVTRETVSASLLFAPSVVDHVHDIVHRVSVTDPSKWTADDFVAIYA